ncbi:MAG: circularly permuted type 2 ATP-grasp protein [Hyphomicrobiaceae bacterium]
MSLLAPAGFVSCDHLVEGYVHRSVGCHDEMVRADGSVRPHWRALLDALGNMSAEDIGAMAAALDRRVHQIGIAYDIFADPTHPSQRWTVDAMPLVIAAEDWHQLERALSQRARLLDSILSDIYGDQSLMRDGLIPPALVFSDPAFLRPAHGIRPPFGFLQFFAADVARGADGRWRVIDIHTETPAGIGSALANRVAHTHVAGELFRNLGARRVAGFFQTLQTAISDRAGRGAPRVALLTPGPQHDDYFSHAYLARYLGYLLVEGSDLRTDDDRVFLKTLEGLKEIDVIVRCVEGRSSDPLELDPGGFAGPVGLMQAVRRSPSLVTNAVGSAVVQNRGLGAYLGRVCRHVLGEDLLIEDAPRRWLGDPDLRESVLRDRDHVVVRRAQEGAGRPGRAAIGQRADVADQSLDAYARDLALVGDGLVAEDRLDFGTTPSLRDGALQPVPFAVRLYLTRSADGFMMMPGGLAMTIDPTLSLGLSSPEGLTRDVWVVGDDRQPQHASLWRPTLETAHVERSQRVTQSRAADDLYWLGRYTERADWTMRVLRSALQRQQEDGLPADGRAAARRCLEVLLTDEPTAPPPFRTDSDGQAIDRLVRVLVAGPAGMRVLPRTCDGLYRVASLTRDRLSLEAWQTLERFQPGSEWRQKMVAGRSGQLLDLIEEGLASLAAFAGLMHENMTRNFGWSFLDMGRRLSRAYNLSEAVGALFGHPHAPTVATDEDEASSLRFLLEVADSFITYRSRYRLDPMLPLVLDLLLVDESNPRSLAFQLARIDQHLESLPQASQGIALPDERRRILLLSTAVRLADVRSLAAGERRALGRLMDQMTHELPELSNVIARRYFSLIEGRPQRLRTRLDQKH